jgi:hypothetical protein
MVSTQRTQALCYIVLGKPCNFLGGWLPMQCLQAFWTDKLNGTRTVFAYVGNQSKDISWRHMELPSPTLEDAVVVGE